MRMKKLAGIMTVLTVLPSMFGQVFAEESAPTVPKAAVCVEKFTIGQGYLVEPAFVTIESGDSGSDIVEKACGKEIFNGGNGVGSYISSIADPDNEPPQIPEFILTAAENAGMEIDGVRETEGALSSQDFSPMSGWLYLVNDKSQSVSLSDYTPRDGDVIRIVYTIFGYGSDMGIDTSDIAEWGGSEPLCPTVSRNAVINDLAAYNSKLAGSGVRKRVNTVVTNLLSTQKEIDKVASEYEFVVKYRYDMGDVDMNQNVNIFDAVAAARSTVGAKLSEKEEVLADMDGNFKVDIFDAVAIAKLTVA